MIRRMPTSDSLTRNCVMCHQSFDAPTEDDWVCGSVKCLADLENLRRLHEMDREQRTEMATGFSPLESEAAKAREGLRVVGQLPSPAPDPIVVESPVVGLLEFASAVTAAASRLEVTRPEVRLAIRTARSALDGALRILDDDCTEEAP